MCGSHAVLLRSPAAVRRWRRGRRGRMAGGRMKKKKKKSEDRGGGRQNNAMHDLLVWHYWAVPHRETQRGRWKDK